MLICREESQSRNKFASTLRYHNGDARVYTDALLWGCANMTLTGDRWHGEIGKFRVNVIRDNLQWCERDLGRLIWHNTELEAAVSLFEKARKGNGIRNCSRELYRKDILTRAVAWLEGSRIITLNWLLPILGSQFPLTFQIREDAEDERIYSGYTRPCLGKISPFVSWISTHLSPFLPPLTVSQQWELLLICSCPSDLSQRRLSGIAEHCWISVHPIAEAG